MTQTSAATPSTSSFEEPKIPEEPAVAPAHEEAVDSTDEVARLEALLFARTRSHGGLQRELERRERLFREALVRISTSTSQEFSALRTGYDAAVARAIEAEVARAELTFALDETRAQLTAAAPAGYVGAQDLSPGVYAATADRAALVAENAENAELRGRFEALRGELNGLRARLTESELAWTAAVVHSQKLEQRVSATQDRLNQLRGEAAELTLLAQTRAARIAELSQAAALDQQELRTLRAQVVAANAAQVALGEAREADRQLWAERLQKHEEREQEAWTAAAAAVARAEARLREFLETLGEPLRELDTALDALNSPGEQRSEAAQPSARFDVSAEARSAEPAPVSAAKPGRIADELASERDRRTKLVAAVRALQAATQSGEPTKPWIEELVELVAVESRPSARRRS